MELRINRVRINHSRPEFIKCHQMSTEIPCLQYEYGSNVSVQKFEFGKARRNGCGIQDLGKSSRVLSLSLFSY